MGEPRFVLDQNAGSFAYYKGKDARSLFTELDADGSGFLDQDECAKMLSDMGKSLGKKDLATAMFFMDSDGNNQISFQEFERWWEKNGGKAKKNREAAGQVNLGMLTTVTLSGKELVLESRPGSQKTFTLRARRGQPRAARPLPRALHSWSFLVGTPQHHPATTHHGFGVVGS